MKTTWKQAVNKGDIVIVQTRSDVQNIRFAFRGIVTQKRDKAAIVQIDMGKRFARPGREADIIWSDPNIGVNLFGKGKTGIILEGDQIFVYPLSPDQELISIDEIIQNQHFIDMSIPVLIASGQEEIEGVMLEAGVNGLKVLVYKDDEPRIGNDIMFFSEIPAESGFHQFTGNGKILGKEYTSDGIDDYVILHIGMSLDQKTSTTFGSITSYLFGKIHVDLATGGQSQRNKRGLFKIGIFKRKKRGK